jgi:hypothetical protein
MKANFLFCGFVAVSSSEAASAIGTIIRNMDAISLLESWYSAQCNGEWEHGYGVKINALDNPGWRLVIDLRATSAESRSLNHSDIERTDDDWVHYWVENCQFNAACGARNLSEAIEIFVRWFEDQNSAR